MVVFFFQAEDGIRDLVRSRGLGDVYKRQLQRVRLEWQLHAGLPTEAAIFSDQAGARRDVSVCCLLYTSDAADERSSVDLGGRRIIKKKKKQRHSKAHQRRKNTKEQNQSSSKH